MNHFSDNYSSQGLLIDLKDGVDLPKIISILERKYADYSQTIVDMELTLKSGTSSMSTGFAAAVVGILAVMAVVIALVLFLIIKIKILREKTMIGLYKSLGFTSKQIIIQIALSFTSIVSVGAVMGGIAGSLFTNKLVSLLLNGTGVKNIHFITNPFYILCVVAGIIVLSFITAYLVALKIKKITPYSLLVE